MGRRPRLVLTTAEVTGEMVQKFLLIFCQEIERGL
jgi:hypothetical protein